MDELKLGCSGIWSDSSEIQAPPGAMRDAVNVRIRRPNVIEPRPGLPATAISGPTSPPRHLLQWAGGMLLIAGGELWHVIQGGATTEVTDPDGASLAITYAESCLVRVSDGVMVPTDNGVYYVDADLDAYPAGIDWPLSPLLTDGGGEGIANNDSVAIRVAISNELPSGRVVRSAPSDPTIYTNDTGSNDSVSARVTLNADVRAGMVIEVYSTETNSDADALGDEMYLAAKHTVTAGDVTAGYVDIDVFSLSGSTTNLGASLYTNETQEGILEANFPPLPAKRVAWFNQMAFYADLEPEASYPYTGQPTGKFQSPTQSFTVTWGSGVTTITVGDTSNFDIGVGQVINESPLGDTSVDGTYFAAGTTITAIGGTTIDISDATLAGSGGPQTFYCHDVVTIDGNTYIASGNRPENREFQTLQQLQALVNADGDVEMFLTEDASTPSTLPAIKIVKAISFSMSTAAGSFYGLFGPSGVTSTVETDVWPARLAWSKTLQPESVPLLNYIDIGSHVEPILALEATRDALYVFKRDGLWRVSGEGPDSLRIDEFDRTIELISPLATTRHRGDIWAWTTQGILRINDGGAQNMSDNTIRDQVEAVQQATHSAGIGGTVYGGLWLGSSETEGIVVAGIPEIGDWNLTLTWYVYETRTGAWVRWSGISEDYGAAASCAEDKGQLVFGTGNENDNGCYLCWADYDNRHDASAATTISTFTADVEASDGVTYPGSITGTTASKGRRILDDASGSAWVLFSSGSERIVSNTLSTTATDGATSRTGFTCILAWTAMVAGNPGQMAHWRNIQMMFADASRLPGVTLGFSTERVPTEGVIEVRSYLDPLRPEPVQLRGSVTRDHARAKRLRIRAAIGWADQDWRLEGIALTFQPMRGGERTP